MAVGDKIYLADKETLDIVKQKVDNIQYKILKSPLNELFEGEKDATRITLADKQTLDAVNTQLDNIQEFAFDGTAKENEVVKGKTFYTDGINRHTGTFNIDNLKPENIKEGITIGGITGNAFVSPNNSFKITSSESVVLDNLIDDDDYERYNFKYYIKKCSDGYIYMNHVDRGYYFYDTIKHIKSDGEVVGLFYNEYYISDCIYSNGYYIYSKVNNQYDNNKREIYIKKGKNGNATLKASFNGNDNNGGGLFFYCGDKIIYTGAQIWKYSTDNGNTWRDCSISGGSFGEILDIYYSVKDKKGLAVGNNGFYKTNDGINYTFNSYDFSRIACQNNIISYDGNDKWYLFTAAGSGANPERFAFAWYQISGTSVKKGNLYKTYGTYIGNQNLGIVKLDGNNVCLFFGVGEAYKSSTDNSIVDRYYKPFMPFIFYLYDYDENKILLSTKGIQGYYNIEDI